MSTRDFRLEYAARLRTLNERPFQTEMECVLASNIRDFQAIVTKPSGDGGLDGLSGNQEIAYLCYGLDLVSGKIANSQIIAKVQGKFVKDFMRLLELDGGPEKGYRVRNNDVLQNILATGRKVKHITLLCNWLEDQRVIGFLQNRLVELKRLSSCNYVDQNCTLNILGPKQIIARFSIGPEAIIRLEHPGLLEAVEQTQTVSTQGFPTPQGDLDVKFDYLVAKRRGKEVAINGWREGTRSEWLKGISLLQQLQNDHPDIYKKVESVRQKIGREAEIEDGVQSTGKASDLMRKYQAILYAELGKNLPEGFPEKYLEHIARYSIAWLIGTCRLDWRQN